MKPVEIICPACGQDALLRREPVYEGFTKTGEELSCTACGHLFESEACVPFKKRNVTPAIFSDADRSPTANIFDDNENKKLCHYCANYVINPFMQYCSTHKKEVQATDTCRQFEEKKEKETAL
jgi:hypothetical protein